MSLPIRPRGGEIHTTSFDIKRINVLHGDDSCSGARDYGIDHVENDVFAKSNSYKCNFKKIFNGREMDVNASSIHLWQVSMLRQKMGSGEEEEEGRGGGGGAGAGMGELYNVTLLKRWQEPLKDLQCGTTSMFSMHNH